MANSKIQKSSMSLELLWTNPNPNNEFTPKTIPLDLSGYGLVYVMARNQNGGANYGIFALKGQAFIFISYTSAKLAVRSFTPSDTGVAFDIAQLISNYGTTTSDNTKVIPFKIYGVK